MSELDIINQTARNYIILVSSTEKLAKELLEWWDSDDNE